MSRPEALDIELTNFKSPPSPPLSYCSSSSGDLYIPVHRRKRWSEASLESSSTPSSSSSSPKSIILSSVPTYDIDDLILLSQSPLARLSADEQFHLREMAPEIVMSKRQRTRLEWRMKKSSQEKSRAIYINSWRRPTFKDTASDQWQYFSEKDAGGS